MSDIQAAAKLLHEAKHITVFTGAGISAESGIKTYRDADGHWSNEEQQLFATSVGYMLMPEKAWRWYLDRRLEMEKALPNSAHYALTDLQKVKPNTDIITQNIDNLHEKAGNQNINHLHGDIFANRCLNNCQGIPTLLNEILEADKLPPSCPHCEGMIRPAVVWFGELLPMSAVQEMRESIQITDLLLVVGLSGAIHYSLPQTIKANGGKVLEINPNLSLITPQADIFIQAPAGQALPNLIKLLESLGQTS